ncbi:MAG: GNAT family N-acetyltransferase [Hyphomicrobiales bacterium]
MQLKTERLCLRCWIPVDIERFAELHADGRVMKDLGGPLSRAAAEEKLSRYLKAYERYGYSRWAVETSGDEFIGYVGVYPRHDEPDHPLGRHDEIGWRLFPKAWGHGYATEAAQAALDDVFARTEVSEVLSYTAPNNHPSLAVMERLNLTRDPSRDFVLHDDLDGWVGNVWAILRPG